MSKRSGIEPHLTNYCLSATSVTVISDHNCETRHIKSITGHKPDQAAESYNERPSMEQHQKMSLVVSDFIGKRGLLVLPLHCRERKRSPTAVPTNPRQIPHQEPGKALLVENSFSTSPTSVLRHGDQRSFPSIFTTVM